MDEKPDLSPRHAHIALQLTQLYGEFKRGSGLAAMKTLPDLFAADLARLERVAESLWSSGSSSSSSSSSSIS